MCDDIRVYEMTPSGALSKMAGAAGKNIMQLH